MRLVEAGGFGFRFGNRRHTWKYVFLRNSQAKVDYRTNKKNNLGSHLPLSCRQRRVSSHLAYITLCVCVWLLNQRAACSILPLGTSCGFATFPGEVQNPGIKSHRHHLPFNPSGADVVLITTFLLLDSFRPFK